MADSFEHNTGMRKRMLAFLMPDWILGYHREWLSSDLTAGLTAAAVVIPMAMAYATIAGLPLQVGLYTALVPMPIYALLGSSRPLSVSTTSTISILAAAQLGGIALEGDQALLLGALAMLTLLVGAVLLLASLLRFGFVANFISHPVLVGFKAGITLAWNLCASEADVGFVSETSVLKRYKPLYGSIRPPYSGSWVMEDPQFLAEAAHQKLDVAPEDGEHLSGQSNSTPRELNHN